MPDLPPNLRALVPTEAAAVIAVIGAAFADVRVDPPLSALRETAASIAEQLAASGGSGAWSGDRLVGLVLWSERADGLYLGRLAVLPGWRRRGIAHALIEVSETEARRRGLPRLHLGTRLMLVDNRRLFAGCGFVEIATHAHPGYEHPTWVEMEKRLA